MAIRARAAPCPTASQRKPRGAPQARRPGCRRGRAWTPDPGALRASGPGAAARPAPPRSMDRARGPGARAPLEPVGRRRCPLSSVPRCGNLRAKHRRHLVDLRGGQLRIDRQRQHRTRRGLGYGKGALGDLDRDTRSAGARDGIVHAVCTPASPMRARTIASGTDDVEVVDCLKAGGSTAAYGVPAIGALTRGVRATRSSSFHVLDLHPHHGPWCVIFVVTRGPVLYRFSPPRSRRRICAALRSLVNGAPSLCTHVLAG